MDQNKFINTYIDVIVNSILEYVKSNLQLQTQLKVHEHMVAERDQLINNLNQQIADNKVAEDWKTKYDAAETNYSAALGKLKHMDILLNQLNEMKKSIIVKDAKIEELNDEINELKGLKKVINKKKKEETPSITEQISQEKTLDDF
jgi:hypothetical protein